MYDQGNINLHTLRVNKPKSNEHWVHCLTQWSWIHSGNLYINHLLDNISLGGGSRSLTLREFRITGSVTSRQIFLLDVGSMPLTKNIDSQKMKVSPTLTKNVILLFRQ